MKTAFVTGELTLTSVQRDAVEATLIAFAQACDFAVAAGRDARTTSNVRLHHLTYQELRRRYGLNANLTIRAIALAARLLKRKDGVPEEAVRVEYDARILSLSDDASTVSLSSLPGRLRGVRIVLNPRDRRLLLSHRPCRTILQKLSDSRYVLHFELAEIEARPAGPTRT